jgi:hypothetical protein
MFIRIKQSYEIRRNTSTSSLAVNSFDEDTSFSKVDSVIGFALWPNLGLSKLHSKGEVYRDAFLPTRDFDLNQKMLRSKSFNKSEIFVNFKLTL